MTFKTETLSELIKSKTLLRHLSTGWDVCKCPACNDYKERGGFKFTGDSFIYNCWNCGGHASHDGTSSSITKKSRDTLKSFGITDDEINRALGGAFFTKPVSEEITLEKLQSTIFFQETKLPEKSFRLGYVEHDMDYQVNLLKYLTDRHVDIVKYPIYFSSLEKFADRVIIPYYYNQKLIYWQTRSIHEHEKTRYLNAPVIRDSIMFNMDKLTTFTKAPLFITEGVFDAMMVDGIAILGSTLNEQKIELLSKSNRRKIFIIDKNLNGQKLANRVLDLGWEIMFTPNNTDDLNHCVKQYGEIWSVNYLMNNIPLNKSTATLQIKLNCK